MLCWDEQSGDAETWCLLTLNSLHSPERTSGHLGLTGQGQLKSQTTNLLMASIERSMQVQQMFPKGSQLLSGCEDQSCEPLTGRGTLQYVWIIYRVI